MRIKAITPIHVPPEELDRRRSRYRRLSPAGLSVELVNLPAGAPDRLESPADVEASSALVAEEAAATDSDAFDAVLPDCALDPGIDVASPAPVPVVGQLRLSASHLHGLGVPFAHVTRNGAIRDELERRLEQYGLLSLRTGHAMLELDFESVAEGDEWNTALSKRVGDLRDQGAAAVINGCSAVDIAAPGAIWIVDPTALALDLLGAANRSGMVATSTAVRA